MGPRADPAVPAPPPSVRELCERVEQDGGRILAAYREPVGDAWQVFALLPIGKVEPTPYQRDLSKPHVEKLVEVIRKLHRFVDPIVAVRGGHGAYWTPNGNHRLAALRKLKAQQVPVILIPDPKVAFQILALNTEKAHNLKDKSLEVVRMYRALVEAAPEKTEQSFSFEFEQAFYVTLGLLYEKKPRFAGSAFSPILRRVDEFLKLALPKAFVRRQERAEAVERTDRLLTEKVRELKRRGIDHPYVKNFVLARVNPLTRARKGLPSFEITFERLEAALKKFDPTRVQPEEVSRLVDPGD